MCVCLGRAAAGMLECWNHSCRKEDISEAQSVFSSTLTFSLWKLFHRKKKRLWSWILETTETFLPLESWIIDQNMNFPAGRFYFLPSPALLCVWEMMIFPPKLSGQAKIQQKHKVLYGFSAEWALFTEACDESPTASLQEPLQLKPDPAPRWKKLQIGAFVCTQI